MEAPEIIAIISTKIMVNVVLNTYSKLCDLAVALIFCLALKYPLITDEIATKKMAGDKATNVISASGICNHKLAIIWAPKNSNKLPTKPIIAKVAKAILKIRYPPLWSPNGNSFGY